MRRYLESWKLQVINSNRSLSHIQVKWSPPKSGWVALNTDGAARDGSEIAGCGGLLRDQFGNCICGFSKFLGKTTVYVAELWGVYEGLRMAKEKGFSNIELQIDYAAVVQCLINGRNGSSRG